MTKSTITREPITHDLKIYPEFFSAVCTGVKRAELRKNDRDYRVGDTIHLMETPRGSCHRTGEFINVKITHIADVGEWMPGYVLMSIELQERRKADSEPVAWRRFQETPTDGGYWILYDYKPNCSGVEPLYRHAQPAPVVPEEMTPEMMRSVQLNSELGAYAASNLSGAYDLFAEFWKEACRAAMLIGGKP